MFHTMVTKRYFLHFVMFSFQFCVVLFILLFDTWLFWFHPNLDVDAGGEGMFCLLEYGLKFITFNGGVFMFRTKRILQCTLNNAIGVQYGITLFQKSSILKH